jgi:ubiquinone/menaquinone biosynthesis C-methylase UbiE
MKEFDQIASEWNSYRQKPISCLSLFMPLVGKQDVILDAGCGNGRNLIVISEKCKKIEGIDSSKEMIKFALENIKKNAVRNGTVQIGSLLDLPFHKNSFDKIFCSAVIHHLNKDEQPIAVADLFKVLKPGGLVFATVWAENRLKEGNEGHVKWGKVQRYHYFFKEEEFEELFLNTGFTDAKTFFEKDGLEVTREDGQNLVLVAKKKGI